MHPIFTCLNRPNDKIQAAFLFLEKNQMLHSVTDADRCVMPPAAAPEESEPETASVYRVRSRAAESVEREQSRQNTARNNTLRVATQVTQHGLAAITHRISDTSIVRRSDRGCCCRFVDKFHRLTGVVVTA